jgi:hypothetical protein
MPEAPEIDTDKLRETIDEEMEKEGGALLRTVALTTAIFAALAAIASLKAGGTANEALVLKTEGAALKTDAARLQNQASDQWAYYQAKGLKATITEAEKNAWAALDKASPADLDTKHERYLDDQKKSKEEAEKFEEQRDERTAEAGKRSEEADHLMHHHHFFAQSVALLQVAIALGAVAALTRKRVVWIGSILLGLGGAGMFGYAFLG